MHEMSFIIFLDIIWTTKSSNRRHRSSPAPLSSLRDQVVQDQHCPPPLWWCPLAVWANKYTELKLINMHQSTLGGRKQVAAWVFNNWLKKTQAYFPYYRSVMEVNHNPVMRRTESDHSVFLRRRQARACMFHRNGLLDPMAVCSNDPSC